MPYGVLYTQVTSTSINRYCTACGVRRGWSNERSLIITTDVGAHYEFADIQEGPIKAEVAVKRETSELPLLDARRCSLPIATLRPSV